MNRNSKCSRRDVLQIMTLTLPLIGIVPRLAFGQQGKVPKEQVQYRESQNEGKRCSG